MSIKRLMDLGCYRVVVVMVAVSRFAVSYQEPTHRTRKSAQTDQEIIGVIE